MAKDTIAFILHGEVPLSLYADALERWSKLIDILSKEVGERADIEWEILQLKSSSPTTIIKGRSPDIEAVEKVVLAQGIVWDAIEHSRPIPYSDAVASRAMSITAVLDGKISSIEIKTGDHNAVVDQSHEVNEILDKSYSYGTVTGFVETISIHNRPRFVIYDLIFNRAVYCHFSKEQEESVHKAFGRRVSVSGKVYRDMTTGRPIEIRDITQIAIYDEVPAGSFENARGILPWRDGDVLPEVTIRRIRDDND